MKDSEKSNSVPLGHPFGLARVLRDALDPVDDVFGLILGVGPPHFAGFLPPGFVDVAIREGDARGADAPLLVILGAAGTEYLQDSQRAGVQVRVVLYRGLVEDFRFHHVALGEAHQPGAHLEKRAHLSLERGAGDVRLVGVWVFDHRVVHAPNVHLVVAGPDVQAAAELDRALEHPDSCQTHLRHPPNMKADGYFGL